MLIHEFEHQGADVVAPAVAGEDAVMAGVGLEMGGLHAFGQAGEEIERGHALAGGGDIVLAAFHRFHRHVGDGAEIDGPAPQGEGIAGDLAVLEDALDGGEVEFGRHVHHREIFVVEAVVAVMIAGLALGHAQDLLGEGAGVTLGIHGHEGGELEEARIDHPPHAAVFEADALDRDFGQLGHVHPLAEIGDVRWRGIGIDGAADQGEGEGLGGGILGREMGGGGERQRHRLADGDHMGIGAEVAHEIGKVEGVILDVEASFAHRDVARVVPIGDPELAIGQQALHGRAQQGGVMARHGGDQQHPARLLGAALHPEADQIAEGAGDLGLDRHHVIAPVFGGDGGDAPIGLGDHAREAALGHLAPGAEPVQEGIGDDLRARTGGHGPCAGAEPLAGVAHGFHEVIGGHVAHVFAFLLRCLLALCVDAIARYVACAANIRARR